MKIGFVNNFSAKIEGVTDTDTTIVLDGGGDKLDFSSAEVYPLTIFDSESGNMEVVYAESVSNNSVTVQRGKESTQARIWPAGTAVEMRLTAGALSEALEAYSDLDDNLYSRTAEEGVSGSTYNTILGPWASASASDSSPVTSCVALGVEASVQSDNSVAVGNQSVVNVGAAGGVAVGSNSAVQQDITNGLSIGGDSYVSADPTLIYTETENQVCVGASAWAVGPNSVRVGSSGGSNGAWNVLVGSDANVASYRATVVGSGVQLGFSQHDSVVIGAKANCTKQGGIAIGAYANSTVEGGMHINALPYIPAEYSRGEAFPPPVGPGQQIEVHNSATQQASPAVVLATDPLDLTDGTAAVTLDLPANTMLFIDSIDVVVTNSDGAGGTPEVSVGPDDVTPAAYLAATVVGKTTVGGRETHSPIVTDGVTSLRVATSTAGTGTTYKAKIVFRGYVMEL